MEILTLILSRRKIRYAFESMGQRWCEGTRNARQNGGRSYRQRILIYWRLVFFLGTFGEIIFTYFIVVKAHFLSIWNNFAQFNRFFFHPRKLNRTTHQLILPKKIASFFFVLILCLSCEPFSSQGCPSNLFQSLPLIGGLKKKRTNGND